MAAATNKSLKQGKSGSAGVMLRTGLVALIERHFKQRAELAQINVKSITNELAKFMPWLSQMKTYRTCLACVVGRAPEHMLPCGHVLCEECCIRRGRSSEVDSHLYKFDECPLCGLACEVSIRVKPATAGVRVLSIDGGGIRAVVPIQFLRALERAIGLDMPVQEHFDFAYGTSSGERAQLFLLIGRLTRLGSIVNAALYWQGMRVDHVHELFGRLSKRVFRGRRRRGGFVAAAHAALTSYQNGQFPAEDIDEPLAEIFGETTTLEHAYMSSVGARVGFPVVNVDTLNTCLVTSYNGVGQSLGRIDGEMGKGEPKALYELMRSQGSRDEVLMRDAYVVRCSQHYLS